MAEQTDTPAAAEAVAETDRPSWLPEKFKDPEAFVEAHKELERVYHASNAERNEARRELEALQAEREALFAEQAQLQRARADQQAESRLQPQTPPPLFRPEQVAAQILEAGYSMAKNANPDWDEWLPAMQQIIQSDPSVLASGMTSPQGVKAAYEAALTTAKAQARLAEASQLSQQARAASSAAMARQKASIQTMSGGGVRQPAETSDEEWARQIREANASLDGFSSFRLPR